MDRQAIPDQPVKQVLEVESTNVNSSVGYFL